MWPTDVVLPPALLGSWRILSSHWTDSRVGNTARYYPSASHLVLAVCQVTSSCTSRMQIRVTGFSLYPLLHAKECHAAIVFDQFVPSKTYLKQPVRFGMDNLLFWDQFKYFIHFFQSAITMHNQFTLVHFSLPLIGQHNTHKKCYWRGVGSSTAGKSVCLRQASVEGFKPRWDLLGLWAKGLLWPA